jgi:hypothetical protein
MKENVQCGHDSWSLFVTGLRDGNCEEEHHQADLWAHFEMVLLASNMHTFVTV